MFIRISITKKETFTENSFACAATLSIFLSSTYKKDDIQAQAAFFQSEYFDQKPDSSQISPDSPENKTLRHQTHTLSSFTYKQVGRNRHALQDTLSDKSEGLSNTKDSPLSLPFSASQWPPVLTLLEFLSGWGAFSSQSGRLISSVNGLLTHILCFLRPPLSFDANACAFAQLGSYIYKQTYLSFLLLCFALAPARQ